jgi:chromosome segregation ATPase
MLIKKFKFKFLILSAFMLTLCSGLLFFRQLFLYELDSKTPSQSSIEDLRYIDAQLNQNMFELRSNLSLSTDELIQNQNRVKELLNVIIEIRKENTDLKDSFVKIKDHFEQKQTDIEKFLKNISKLQKEIKELNPLYNELQKNNIKFNLDGKDFYRECISDSLMYILNPSKDIEWKINEDSKILTQIIGFSKGPNPPVENYYAKVESIRKSVSEIDKILKRSKDKSIIDQMNIVAKFDIEQKVANQDKGQIFLFLVYASIFFYILGLFYVFRKL